MLIIINDPGGSFLAHVLLGQHYAAIGAKLIVVYCASVCLNMLVMVPKDNICFRSSAWIGYHTSAEVKGVESPTTMRWERGRDWIARGWKECK